MSPVVQRLLVVVGLIALVAACDDASYSRTTVQPGPPVPPPNGPNVLPDDDGVDDPVQPGVPISPEQPGVIADGRCADGAQTFELGYLDARQMRSRHALLDDGWIYFTRETESLAADSPTELFRYSPAANIEERLTDDNEDWEMLLDARDGQYLYKRGRELVVAEGPEPTLVVDGDVVWGSVSDIHLFVPQTRLRFLSDGLPVWRQDPSGQLYRFDGAEVVRLDDDERSNVYQVDALGSRVAWVYRNIDGYNLVLSDGDTTRAVDFDDEDDQWPLLDDDALYWISAGRIMTLDLTSDEVHLVHDGDWCHSMAAANGQLVFACNESPRDDEDAVVGRLYHYDGKDVRPVVTEGGFPRAVAIDGDTGRLAWAEFDTTTCHPTEGGVFISDDITSPPTRLDDIGRECTCCGTNSGVLRVYLEGDVVSWNYALPTNAPAEPPLGRVYLGYALVGCGAR